MVLVLEPINFLASCLVQKFICTFSAEQFSANFYIKIQLPSFFSNMIMNCFSVQITLILICF